MQGIRSDIRLALRLMRKSPWMAAAAVLALGLGVGSNVAIFGILRAVLLRPSPLRAPDRLVMVWETDRSSKTRHEPASWPDVVDMRRESRTLAAIGSLLARPATLTVTGGAERVSMLAVTPNLPALLGVPPILGRTFAADEGQPGGPRVVLLGEEYWRRRFGADPGVLGRRLTIDERPATVVGVLPADADLGIAQIHQRADYSAPLAGAGVEMWLATEPSAADFPRQTHPFLTIGRLAPGATLDAAQAELAGVMARLERQYQENAARGVHLEPYPEVVFGAARPALRLLAGAVALLLLVACANVANLLLARATGRVREVAVRRALGAPTMRLVRQFVVESGVLTALAAVAGVVCAWGGLHLLLSFAPATVPRLAATRIDVAALGFTAALAALVGIACGLAPILRVRRVDLREPLQSGRGSTPGQEGRRLRSALVVAEVAMAVALVIGAGVLVRSFWTLARVDPGFRTARVLKAEYELPDGRYPLDYSHWPQEPEILRFQSALLERARAVPGVESAALSARHPLDAGFTNSFAVVGREAEAKGWPEIRCRLVSTGYLATLDVPLVAGRALRDGDVAGETPVAMINRAAARRYFAGREPIGERIRFWGTPWQVVGIVGDERFLGLDHAAEPAVYVSMAQAPQQSGVLLVRTKGDPQLVAGALRGLVREIDPGVALHGVEPLAETVAGSLSQRRFVALLLGVFGGVAILLALGATRGHVTALVLREGGSLAVLGTCLGVVAALAGSRLLASLVFGVSAHDGGTYAAVVAGALALAALACWLPARRAARADALLAASAD